MKKRFHLKYFSLSVLCLLLLVSCDSQSDDDTNEITATFRPLPSGEVVPDYERPALGMISVSKDQAVPLSRFPHRSFSIADDGYSSSIEFTMPDELQSSVFLLFDVPEASFGPRLTDFMPSGDPATGKYESGESGIQELRVYGFILENENVEYPSTIRAAFSVNNEDAHFDLLPAEHMVTLAEQSITIGNEFSSWPAEQGLAVRFESDTVDSLFVPALIADKLTSVGPEGASERALHLAGNANAFATPVNYSGASVPGVRIVDDSVLRLLVFRQD